MFLLNSYSQSGFIAQFWASRGGPHPIPCSLLGMTSRIVSIFTCWWLVSKIDYVRIYQPKDQINVGCNPPDYPTEDYIQTFIEAYTKYGLVTRCRYNLLIVFSLVPTWLPGNNTAKSSQKTAWLIHARHFLRIFSCYSFLHTILDHI